MPKKRILSTAVAALWIASGSARAEDTYIYAPWLTQIGISRTILSAANWGKDQFLGVVDTGTLANHPSFSAGQVSIVRSGCAGVTFSCLNNGFVDDNGHGTAVAAIAAASNPYPYWNSFGGYTVSANSMV